MEIGSKIRQSRMEAKITQEQVAEILGVSRQTISNWENEKSYPDIISVLKMSDLYQVSLDYLLKGETSMNNYMDFLDESTNVVKSKNRLSKLILILTYFVFWTIAVIAFWCFLKPGDEMGYTFLYFYIVTPFATLMVSFIIGENNYWGRWKWLATIVFGIMYMMLSYCTFDMAWSISMKKVAVPRFSTILVGMIISLIGMTVGHLLYFVRSRTKKKA
ncbi:DNA-binding transcriptional regulator, XRE-family HTH domain [Acetitomaculum ruminis DSM 5522]|uniref:DNA-binding transcriptional regulator, XRE-family HTH domain n=1 Tax=Acetitomaculum ruminis DSM 5522 TaxID=1120918 RepID=A0A1I0Y5L4_9FIRM|nr:helix-turn-helix transcriptional regulator [Acetitomaculum ruminis]SFB07738.1 DNA-binding transcriptional regulator, XRE-family HTH domain [Acetitomaculum ruminis DSM 5522]